MSESDVVAGWMLLQAVEKSFKLLKRVRVRLGRLSAANFLRISSARATQAEAKQRPSTKMNQQMHAGLRDYLSASSPTSITAPKTSPRLPVGPNGSIPFGIRPIPTSSQSNKKTNAQIPYQRMAVASEAVVGGVYESAKEGEIVLVERVLTAKRKANLSEGKMTKVLTVEQVNA